MKLVTVANFGTVMIDAKTNEEALVLAGKKSFEEVEWSTDFSATDVEDID